jgi:serine protease Do
MGKTTFRALAAAGATLIALGSAPPVYADESNLDAKVGKSLVYLQIEMDAWVQIPASAENDHTTKWSDEVKSMASCSGVIVDPTGFIATASHCVDPTFAENKQGIYQQLFQDMNMSADDVTNMTQTAVNDEWPIEGKGPGSPVEPIVTVVQVGQGAIITQPTTAQILDHQPVDNGDNAVIRVPNEPPLPALPVADKAPTPGTDLVSVGFPGVIGQVMDTSRLPAPSYLAGTASSSQVTPSGAAQTEVTAALSNGMSGGPTVNSDGVVLGLNDISYGADNGANSNFITDAATLHAFLGKNNVQLVSLAPPAKPVPWLLYAGIGAGVLLLLIGGGVVLVVRGKKRTPPPVPQEFPSGPLQYPSGPPQYPAGPPQYSARPQFPPSDTALPPALPAGS